MATILVIDDEPNNRTLLSTILGYRTGGVSGDCCARVMPPSEIITPSAIVRVLIDG